MQTTDDFFLQTIKQKGFCHVSWSHLYAGLGQKKRLTVQRDQRHVSRVASAARQRPPPTLRRHEPNAALRSFRYPDLRQAALRPQSDLAAANQHLELHPATQTTRFANCCLR